MADIAANTGRGLLTLRDELAGWLAGMDRYNGGGDRPFWLEAYGGKSYTVDRKGSPEPVFIEHLSIGVLGGTQPEKLDELLLQSADDGLLARFLVVLPDMVPIKRYTGRPDEERIKTALRRLRGLQQADGNPLRVLFTDEAGDRFHQFRLQCREWETQSERLMKSHVGKLPGHVVRVANVLAHLDWAGGSDPNCPTSIDLHHVERACLYVGEHLRTHAQRAYGVGDAPSEERRAARLA
ncbi:MAG: YfjI family protein [Mangrovicoccus sp.]|nr:YfjI family protein [Mangrovicoccus sp.]